MPSQTQTQTAQPQESRAARRARERLKQKALGTNKAHFSDSFTPSSTSQKSVTPASLNTLLFYINTLRPRSEPPYTIENIKDALALGAGKLVLLDVSHQTQKRMIGFGTKKEKAMELDPQDYNCWRADLVKRNLMMALQAGTRDDISVGHLVADVNLDLMERGMSGEKQFREGEVRSILGVLVGRRIVKIRGDRISMRQG